MQTKSEKLIPKLNEYNIRLIWKLQNMMKSFAMYNFARNKINDERIQFLLQMYMKHFISNN